jgi:hypothetical protein
MSRPLSVLDLFAGTGSASRAMAVRGWRVYRVDLAPDAAADEHVDLGDFQWAPPLEPWDLVWASPPCTAFSTANQRTRNVEAGLELVRASLRIIQLVKPRWWVIENVHGATRAIGSLIGPPVQQHGSVYLWGVFPPFEAVVPRDKTKKSGRQRARRRAAIPWPISDGLARACEQLAAELPHVPRGAPELAPDLLSAAPELAPGRLPPAPGRGPSSPRSSPPPAPSGPPAIAGVAPGAARGAP